MYEEQVKRLHRCAAEAAVVTDAELMIVAREAADAIEALSAENERLRKAVLRYEDELGILDKLPLVDQREAKEES